MWYPDGVASFHMTGDKELFSDLEEKDLQMHIEMGDDGRYNATGIGTITFERESGNPFLLKNVMHVSGLKKNLSQSQRWKTWVMILFLVREKLSFEIKKWVKPRR